MPPTKPQPVIVALNGSRARRDRRVRITADSGHEGRIAEVCVGPQAAITRFSANHLVGLAKQQRRNGNA
jgi:hypothetical protein